MLERTIGVEAAAVLELEQGEPQPDRVEAGSSEHKLVEAAFG
jgi:hypothetical protein